MNSFKLILVISLSVFLSGCGEKTTVDHWRVDGVSV
jgi:uncharacterized lipoprotein YehR (DUF1307 family)